MKKKVGSAALTLMVLAPLAYFFPYVVLAFVACGLYDVLRNTKRDGSVFFQYFFGNGLFTWLLSPFNLLLDVLSLPFLNKGIYRLEDLPAGYRAEIQQLIETAHQEDIVAKVEERTKTQPRSMIFFKWYGANIQNFATIPAYHDRYRYIQTIGLSVFNRRESTSRHFGPLRATLRVLYNVNRMEDHSAYIEVGKTKHYWKDEPLFIFDDTLLHQSFNESDKPRYCLFVDILRPSLLSGLFVLIVRGIRGLLRGANYVFYKNWKVIEK